MLVIPFMGRQGDPICHIDGVLCLFERRVARPEVGVEVEVMISSHLTRRFPPGYFDRPEHERDGGFIAGLIVQPVTEDHVLVGHRGFECAGTMCRTTASVTEEGERAVCALHPRGITWLTPGRTPVIVTDNVNTRSGEPWRPLSPGKAYVSLSDLRAGYQRITGVPDLDHVDPFVRGILVRRRAWERKDRAPGEVTETRYRGRRAAAGGARGATA